MTRKMLILTGEGIECEKEAMRFFSIEDFGVRCGYLPVPKLLRGEIKLEIEAKAGDWLFFPGGFSFADHYGSGKLLAYNLREAKVFDRAIEIGMNLLGNCNGFQVLTEAGFFGKGVRLEPNENKSGDRIGFINRWVNLSGAGKIPASEKFFLPVRHGEGSLKRDSKSWDEGVEPFLFYDDANFDNGSIDRIAGLHATRKRSQIWGMMPHPEISLRPIDGPDSINPEFTALFRAKTDQNTGDGVRLMKSILREEFI